MARYIRVLLFLCLLTFIPYTQVHASPAQQQTATTYSGIINSTANIRSGPGLNYAVIGQAEEGQVVTVIGCNDDCTWYKLDTEGWIAAFLVDLVRETGSAETRGSGNGLLDREDLVISDPSETALAIVEEIVSYTGLPQTFEVYSANIYNAASLISEGKRVILYDPKLIEDIENVTNHQWSAVSILAHEIGHHLAGHTLAEEYIQQFELEADYFSGFILYKMGANLEEAQSVMSLLRDHPNMDEADHPPQVQRLAAIENGWRAAERQEDLTAFSLSSVESARIESLPESSGNRAIVLPTLDRSVNLIAALARAVQQQEAGGFLMRSQRGNLYQVSQQALD